VVGLALIGVVNARARGNLRKIKIHVHVLHAELERIAQHVELYQKALLGERLLIGLIALCDHLRVRDIGAAADVVIATVLPDRNRKLVVESGVRRAVLQRCGEREVRAVRRTRNGLCLLDAVVIWIQRKKIEFAVLGGAVSAHGAAHSHLILGRIRMNLCGFRKCRQRKECAEAERKRERLETPRPFLFVSHLAVLPPLPPAIIAERLCK